MENSLENKNDSLRPPKTGEIVEGQVIGLGRSALYFDLGPIGTGIIYGQEFFQSKSILKDLKKGEKLFAKIVDMENEEGYVELSLSEADREMGWGKLQERKDLDQTITVKVLGANKGGLIVEAEAMQGFLPVSQLSPENYPRVEGADKSKILTKLQKLIGQSLQVKILDLNAKKDIFILSEKATELKKIKEALKNYQVDSTIEGEITGIVEFGAFIKILPDNLEGLIHISELDWQLIDNPSEIVKVGEKVRAKIIEITEDGRISLSLKALKQDPWADIEDIYHKGDDVKGKVTKLNPFGAFVEIAPKIQGLVHISEFGTKTKMEETMKIGQDYNFKIIQIEPKEHRMSLQLSV